MTSLLDTIVAPFRPLLAWPKTRLGELRLRRAARDGRADRVQLLLDAGIAPDVRGLWAGATPLTLAARGGHAGAVAVLLAASARVDTRTRRGATALILAAQGGHGAVVEALLTAGADPDAPLPRSGATAVVVASVAGHVAVVRALLRAGADPELATREGGTALTYATSPGVILLLRTAVTARLPLARGLVRHG